jgi:cell division protein FtsB
MSRFNHFVGISNNIKVVYKAALLVVIFVYLLFHAISGENGLISYVNIKKQIEEQSAALQRKNSELEMIKRKVELLSNQSLDLDLLEEQCRIVLNYCYPEEVIIRNKVVESLR